MRFNVITITRPTKQAGGSGADALLPGLSEHDVGEVLAGIDVSG